MSELHVKNRHILVVDDDTVTREFFSVMLSKLGFSVSDAADGNRALEIVKNTSVDLIILDNILPKILGWDLVKMLRLREDAHPEHLMPIPIIMLSAMTSVEDKVRAYELGVEDYIEKPFNFTEVLARINAILRHKLAIEQLLQREHRIAVKDSLHESLTNISTHVKEPLSDLKKLSESGVADDTALLKKYQERTYLILDAIEQFEKDLEQILEKEDALRADEITSATIVAHYKKQSSDFGKLLNTTD